jgi:hypothetical protein
MAKALGRYKCNDALGVRSTPVRDRRARDQEGEGEEEAGRLICRVIEGRDGNMHIVDAGRLRLRARRSKDGTLEIRHHEDDPDDEQTGDAADPDVVGTYPGIGGDPAKAAATGDALARFARTGKPEHHMAALSDYQRRLDEFYRR